MALAWAIRIRDNKEITLEDVPNIRRQEVHIILQSWGLDDCGLKLV